MTMTIAYIKAIVSLPANSGPELDDRLYQSWHKGALSERQNAGFYEVIPERYPVLMAAYRERIKRLNALAKWRRAHPEPEGNHIAWLDAKGKVVDVSAHVTTAWAEYHGQSRNYENMTGAQKRKAIKPVAPKGPTPQAHQRWQINYGGYGPKNACKACTVAVNIHAAWKASWFAQLDKLGIERPDNANWTGQNIGIYPDGSFAGSYLKYPPLPIRSPKAVTRDRRLVEGEAA